MEKDRDTGRRETRTDTIRVPELGTRRSKGNKGRPTRAPRWTKRDGATCGMARVGRGRGRERERERRINGVANDGRADKRDN